MSLGLWEYFWPAYWANKGDGSVLYAATGGIVPYSRSVIIQTYFEPVALTGPEQRPDRWFVPFSQPVALKPTRQPDINAAPFNVETITIDKWFAPLKDPVALRPYPLFQPYQYYVLGPVNGSGDVSASYIENLIPYYITLVIPTQFEAVQSGTETITVDKWYNPISSPTALKTAFQPDSSYYSNYLPKVTDYADVYRPLSEPTLRLPVTYPDSVTRHPFPVTGGEQPDRWFAQLSTPTKLRPQTYPDSPLPNPFPVPGAEQPDRWFAQLSQPVALKPRTQPDALYWSTRTEFKLEWIQPLATPTKLRPQTQPDALYYSNYFPFVTDYLDVYRPLSEPVRLNVAFQPDSYYWSTFTPASTEFIGPDKYWRDLSQPVALNKAFQPDSLYYGNYLPKVTDYLDVYRPLSEPVRLRDAYQPAALYYGNYLPVVTDYLYVYAPLSEPTKLRPQTYPDSLSWSTFTPTVTPPVTTDLHNLPFFATLGKMKSF